MELHPRFSNKAIRHLFESSGIDLLKLDGAVLTDPEKRRQITMAACDGDPEVIAAQCDNMTPGEHLELIRSALMRDLVPASFREATAKAAAPTKSEEP